MPIIPNAVRISATPSSPLPEKQSPFTSKHCISLYMSPFTFQHFGNEGYECQQLTAEGWKNIAEGGKFYPQKGDEWYYYAYIDTSATKYNPIATFLLSRQVYGDAIVLISGPMEADTESLIIHPHHIVETTWWYKFENHQPMYIFGERERSRMTRKSAFGMFMTPDIMTHMYGDYGFKDEQNVYDKELWADHLAEWS